MTAFCRTEVFDLDVLYLLQLNFELGIDQNFETLVTMYCAHQSWIQYMKNQCENDRNHSIIKHYSRFKKNALKFQKHILTKILELDEVNIKGIFLVLS